MEGKLREIHEIFKRNLLGAAIISETTKENCSLDIFISLKKDIEKLEKEIGIWELNKNEALVLIISAFECFFREFFKIIIDNDSHIKKRFSKIMKNKEIKDLNLEKIYQICEKKLTFGDIICEKHSFTSITELRKLCDHIGIEFDELFDNTSTVEDKDKKEIEELLENFPINAGVIEKLIFIRNKFIHEGKVSIININLLHSLIISLQLMASKLIFVFLKKHIPFGYFFTPLEEESPQES